MTDDHATSIDESCRRSFEADRRNGGARRIEDFLPADGDPRYLATLEELVIIDLEFLWKQCCAEGESGSVTPPTVDEYVLCFPRLSAPHILARLRDEERRCRRNYADGRTVNHVAGNDSASDTQAETLVPARDATAAAPGPAARIDRYELLAEHGRGGFASVWRANDPKLGRDVALKQLKREFAAHPDMRRRFVVEAQVAARLEHPGIVPVHDLGQVDADNPYYTMKLVSGETLSATIAKFHDSPDVRFHSVEFHRLLELFLAVCRTMEYAHDRGVIHRDLKPQNIVVGEYGETIILDWGLAKVLRDESAGEEASASAESDDAMLTMAGDVKGTPAFMSPEQAAGRVDEVDQLSDVYALGVILYQLLCGRLPFAGNRTAEVLERVVSGEALPLESRNPRIPRPLQAICRRAMEKDRAARFASVRELRSDVERYLADEPVVSYREPLSARLVRRVRRHRTLTATTAVAVILLAVAAVVGIIVKQRADRRELEQAADLQIKDAEVERNKARAQRSNAEAQRREDQRIASLRTSTEVAETAALADLREGRFAAAHDRLKRAFEQIRAEPPFAERRESLAARIERAGRLSKFHTLSEASQRNSYLRRDAGSVQQCRDALATLKVFQHADWWAHLPTEDLNGEQVDRLQWEVYHTLMLFSVMTAQRASILDRVFLTPSARQRYRTILATAGQAQRFRYSAGLDSLQRYCQLVLNVRPRKEITLQWQPHTAADNFFCGSTMYFLSTMKKEPFIVILLERARKDGFPLQERMAEHRGYLKAAADASPRHFWMQMMHGLAERDAGNLPGAMAAYDRCVALRPDDWLAYFARGSVRLMVLKAAKPGAEFARQMSRAQRDAERARELAPNEAVCYWLLGMTSSYFPAAASAAVDPLHKALDLFGPMTVAGSYRDARVLRRTIEGLRLSIEAWRKQRPDEPALQLFSARTQVELGLPLDPDDAKKARAEIDPLLAAALNRDPRNPYGYVVRGLLHEEDKNPNDTLNDFRRAAGLAPDCFPAVWGLARTQSSLKRHGESLATFERLSGIAGTDWQKTVALVGRSRQLLALNRPADANTTLAQALAIDPRADLRSLRQAVKDSPHAGFRRTVENYRPPPHSVTADIPAVRAGARAALLDGGFELGFSGRYWTGTAKGLDPPSWTLVGEFSSNAVAVTDARHSGNRSLRIRSRSPSVNGSHGWTEQTMPCIPGAECRLTFYGRGRELKPRSFFVTVGDATRGTDWLKLDLPAGTYGWKQFSSTFRVPADRTEMTVRIVSRNTGAVWLDDFEIRLTSVPQPAGRPSKAVQTGLMKNPSNPTKGGQKE